MFLKGKDRWNDGFELVMYVMAAVCLVYFLIRGVWAKVLEAVLIVIILAAIRIVVKLTRTPLFPALRFCILLFIFITMFLANEFGMYGVIPNLDDIEHLFSGVILCFVGLLIFRQLSKHEDQVRLRASLIVWFSLFFAVAMAGCWEIYEFSLDGLFGLNSQGGSLDDTMVDIICGTIGAVCTSLYLIYRARRGKLP